MRAVIAGAGVAGLSSAIALRKQGIEVTVLERASAAQEIQVGGCIHVWHNGMRGLQRIGVGERLLELAGAAAVVDRAEFCTSGGRLMYGWSVREIERQVGSPTFGVRRPDLHRVLLDAVDQRNVRFGETCVGFEQDNEGVKARLASGGEEQGDVLIGADGMHSALRAQLPGATEPRYAGYVSWQAIARVDSDVIPVGLFRVVWGRAARFLFYRIGAEEVYWEGTFAAPAGGGEPVQERRQAVLERFHGWPQPIQTIVQATDTSAITRADMYDRPTSKHWGVGRVTLIGDAAHAMTNALGQGANQAIEDAVVLARCVAAEDPVKGLRNYEAERIPRTTKFASMSWSLARASRLHNPLACALRNGGLTIGFRMGFARQHPKEMDYSF
ncbi:MAG TPA: FAD-dependent monooxygenase [Solirubrobacteraceae bacterium]|jgi:2-polyprenyl-6-methoxyphenol hydroxylase-like FAD-dependent oxidoreductase|nr:FAD-dependent monooxygenase [Solirubrobacteraceae bacterium]